jgi:hypothetical protein
MALFLMLLLAARAGSGAGAPGPDWQAAARKVHSGFTGRKGTFATFGDSITNTMAFWAPLRDFRAKAPPEMAQAYGRVSQRILPECWREWKGPRFGNDGGQTSRWAQENVDGWLKRLNPEVALLMFGTNDLHSMEVEEYRTRMRAVVRNCLSNGTVVILSTIPPRHGFEKKAETFAQAIRDLAREMQVPLTDYHREILKRRPEDWDGAADRFAQYRDYEVPTLLSRDGVHPSYPKQYQNDYSAEGLSRSGYTLRSYLALLAYAEVLRVLDRPASFRPRSGVTGASGFSNRELSPPATPAPSETLICANPSNPCPPVSKVPAKPPVGSWFPKAPPLPPPGGQVIRVTNTPELFRAAEQVRPGGTILLAEGRYPMERRLEIRTDRVTLRGASGDRDRVVLDGGGSLGELVAVTSCSGVTIADLTAENVRWNGIKINSETGVHQLTIRNCVLHNIWQRAVKGVMVPPQDREKIRPSGCRVEYCLFYNDRPKQFADDPTDTAQTFNGNYIGGIDVMYAKGWTISDNAFVGIRGRTGEARGAVFIWVDSRDCVVERNIITDCDAGICLGNSYKHPDTAAHCTGTVVRNNFVTGAPQGGIVTAYTRDCQILNNTVHDPASRLGRLIRIVHENPGLEVINNLVSGPRILIESESRLRLGNNLEKDLTGAFAAPAEGDLHLTARAAEAVDRADPLAEVKEDIDRRPRGSKPDLGAHELSQR